MLIQSEAYKCAYIVECDRAPSRVFHTAVRPDSTGVGKTVKQRDVIV